MLLKGFHVRNYCILAELQNKILFYCLFRGQNVFAKLLGGVR